MPDFKYTDLPREERILVDFLIEFHMLHTEDIKSRKNPDGNFKLNLVEKLVTDGVLDKHDAFEADNEMWDFSNAYYKYLVDQNVIDPKYW